MTPVWTTSRASGLAALMTASLAISCGLLMALRIPALRRRAPELRAAHQALANATFALIGVHAVSLLLDPVLRPGLAGLLVPFAAPYRPVATALGPDRRLRHARAGRDVLRPPAHRHPALALGAPLAAASSGCSPWRTACSSAPTRRRRGRWSRSRRPWPRPPRWWRRGCRRPGRRAAAVIAAARRPRSPGDARHRRRLVPPRPARRATCPRSPHACREHERVVPLFVFDPRLLRGRFRSHGRTAWMLELPRGARRRAARARRAPGRAPRAPARPRCGGVAREAGARAVHVSDDVDRLRARARRARGARRSARDGVALRRHPGPLRRRPAARSARGQGGPYTVFSPFLRAWRAQERRRARARAARDRAWRAIAAGGCRRCARWASTGARRASTTAPSRARPPARRAARALAARRRRSSATPSAATCWPSRPRACPPTCASAASRRCGSSAAVAARRRRALPRPARLARLLRRRAAALPDTRPRRVPGALPRPEWDADADALAALARGRAPASPSSTPRMRQLAATGWMHNRARMIVGSFLTKDLQQDWREGERHFMAHLLDGDVRHQQRRLAVDRLDRHRPRALLPAPLQPDDPAAPVRPRRALRAPLVPRAAPTSPTTGSPSRGR